MKKTLGLLALIACLNAGEARASIHEVNVEGDSLSAGFGLTPTGSNWVGLLRDTYTAVGFSSTAVSGKRWEPGWVPDVEASDATSWLSSHSGDDRRTQVFWVGINDIAGGNSFASMTNWCMTWIATVRAADPTVRIVGITCLKITGMTGGQETIRGSWNNWLRYSNQVDRVVDLDLVANLSDPSNGTYFQGDGVHTTIAGNVQVAVAAAPVVLGRWNVRKDGNDSNSGLIDSAGGAFLTLQKAASMVYPHDEVRFSGFYTENVTLTSNGVYGLPGGPRGWINWIGSGVTTTTNYGWTLTGADYNRVASVACSNSTSAADSFAIDLNATAMNNVFSNIIISGANDWVSRMGGVQAIQGATNNVFDKIVIINPNYHHYSIGGVGTIITNGASTGNTGWDVYRIVASNVRITHNAITNLNNIEQRSGTVIAGVTYGYIVTGADDGDFSNVGGGAPGTYDNGDSFEATMTAVPTSYGAVGLDNANHSDIFQTFGDNSDVSTNVLFEANFIYACTNYQMGIATDDQENFDISHWTFQNNSWAYVSSHMRINAPNFQFLHETYYKCVNNDNNVLFFASGTAGHGTNYTIYNCAFIECGDTPSSASDGWYWSPDATNGWKVDYNHISGTGGGTKNSNLGAGGTDSHSQNGGTPGINTTTLQPMAGSILLGAGTNIVIRVPKDQLFVTRTDPTTIGAFEDEEGEAPPTGVTGTRPHYRIKGILLRK